MAQVYPITTRTQDNNAHRDELTAPVRIPAREDMEVTLMPTTVLDRLEEYRGEQSTWFSIFGVFVGVIGGVFVNVATGGTLGASAVVLLLAFLVMATAAGWFARQAKRRGDALKRKFLNAP